MDMCGKQSLHSAAQLGDCELVKEILLSHSPINSLKRGDWTPLMLAAAKGHLDVVNTLVASGASLAMRNKDGWTVLHIACRNGSPDICNAILERCPHLSTVLSKNGRSCLHIAALHGNKDVIQLLINSGVWNLGVDCRDNCGTTPLMDAARAGHTAIVKMLLDAGADVLAVDGLGRSAIHLSAQAGCLDSLLFLQTLFPNLSYDEQTQTDGSTALMLAAREGHVDVVCFLLSNRVDRNKQDHHGRTALDHAVIAAKLSVVRLLQSC